MARKQEEQWDIVQDPMPLDLREGMKEEEWDTAGGWDVDMPGEGMEEALDSSEGASGEEEDLWVECSAGGGGKMPGGDESGPLGRGPMTGRGAGYCAGFNVPGFARGFAGRGMGYGRGMGRGYAQGEPGRGFGGGRGRGMGRGLRGGYGYYEPDYYPTETDRPAGPYHPGIPRTYIEPSPEEEKKYLEDLVKGMETELEDIRKRIGDLTKEE